MLQSAQILRRHIMQFLRELVHSKAGRVGCANAMQRKIQIEGRVFPVREQRIPYLIAPREKNIRLRRIGL